MRIFDHVVIGSGIAGLTYALKAARTGRVAIVTKKSRYESNTIWAQGGIACPTSDEDSIALHAQDTIRAGDALCDASVVRSIISEGSQRISELISLGMRFDERLTPEGKLEPNLGKEGGHSKRRIYHAKDTTGLEIEKTLLAAVSRDSQIVLLENHMAIDLISVKKLGFEMQDHCVGLYVLNKKTGEVETLRSDVTVLATGGCGRVYQYTTNPDIATGDGVAMAWRAGATIANMEFIQFHPTCLYHPKGKSFLITEAVRGEGGILLNDKGQRFMGKYDSRLELATRDIVARAIDAEMKASGIPCVYLDISHQSADFLRERFPGIYSACLNLNIDITKQPIPVVPAAHYQCGGVKSNAHGETTLCGLFAIGETACTGLHGANRLASNSLLEALVMSHRAVAKATELYPKTKDDLPLPSWSHGQVDDLNESFVFDHTWDEIRRIMWDYVGIIRTDKRLHYASNRLKNLQIEIQKLYWNFKITEALLELRNLATTASLIIDSCISRKESRGLHYTIDYPKHDDASFLHETLIKKT